MSTGKPCCGGCAAGLGCDGGATHDHEHDHHDHGPEFVVVGSSGQAAPATGQVLNGTVRAAAAARVGAPTGLPAAVRAAGAVDDSTSMLRKPWVVPTLGVVGLGAAAAIAYYAMRNRGPASCREAAKTLGVSAAADAARIRAAHKQRALKVHPDRGGDAREMARVNTARDILLSGACAR